MTTSKTIVSRVGSDKENMGLTTWNNAPVQLQAEWNVLIFKYALQKKV